MGRSPCCDKANVKKGPWSPEEDAKLKEYIEKHGTGGNWIAFPQKAGLRRCGKSCRLRWLNYLRPNIKHGEFSEDEDRIICSLFASIGSRWSIIAAQLPGRTDNDIKNYWNTKLKKKLIGMVHPSQKNPHFFLQTSSPSPSSSSSPSPSLSPSSSLSYRCCNNINTYYSTPSSFLSNTSSATAASILQPQEISFVGSISMQNYQVEDSNLLMFGGEPSCSSSDGSCNNQLSHGKNYEYGEQMVLQNYFYSGEEEHQKLMVSNGGGSGVHGWSEINTALDYGFEEIKQLISTTNCTNSLFDENKTEERVMYY